MIDLIKHSDGALALSEPVLMEMQAGARTPARVSLHLRWMWAGRVLSTPFPCP